MFLLRPSLNRSVVCERYIRLGMLPLAAQPAEHCSMMRTRSPVFGICLRAAAPAREEVAEAALEQQLVADRRAPRRLLEPHRVQVAVAVGFGRGRARWRSCRRSRSSLQTLCSSQNTFSLLRGVTCAVMRPLAFCHVLSLNACRDLSGS